MLIFLFGILSSCSYFSLDCGSLFGQDRENCFADTILKTYETDPKHTLQILDKEISSSTYDFLLMELTRKYHPQSRHLCQKMKDVTLQERCMIMVSRPHLQRKKMEE